MAERILICDDDEDIARAVRINLELAGYEVHEARDGYELLDAARRLRPGLVLLDVVMPGMDGIEVCRELRADPRTHDTAVIFLTARTATRDEALGLLAGADDYVVKPFDPADLVARVHALLNVDGGEVPPPSAVTLLIVGVGAEHDAAAAAVAAGLLDAGHGPITEVRCAPRDAAATLQTLRDHPTGVLVTVGWPDSLPEATGSAD